jgi:hypothetical protein
MEFSDKPHHSALMLAVPITLAYFLVSIGLTARRN